MKEYMTYIDQFTVQQNNYKSLCQTFMIDKNVLKLFFLIEYEKGTNINIINDILEGINYSFNKMIKSPNLDSENIEFIFEESIKDLNKYILDLIQISNINIDLTKLNLLIGSAYNNLLIYTIHGSLDGFIIYKSKDAQYKINKLIEDPKENKDINYNLPLNIFTNVVTGEIIYPHIIFFATKSISKYLSSYKIKYLLLSEEKTLQNFSTILKQTTNNNNFSGILIKKNT